MEGTEIEEDREYFAAQVRATCILTNLCPERIQKKIVSSVEAGEAEPERDLHRG